MNTLDDFIDVLNVPFNPEQLIEKEEITSSKNDVSSTFCDGLLHSHCNTPSEIFHGFKESLINFYARNGFEVNNIAMKKFIKK